MQLSLLDGIAFVAFILLVVGVSLYASRREEGSEDYFLAGRNLTWWLIGISLIASDISTEHFIGMAGAGYGDAGLASAAGSSPARKAMPPRRLSCAEDTGLPPP